MGKTNVVSESESLVSPIAGADGVANATDLRWPVFGHIVLGGITSLVVDI